jgi:hypothetical protein
MFFITNQNILTDKNSLTQKLCLRYSFKIENQINQLILESNQIDLRSPPFKITKEQNYILSVKNIGSV